jgi:hypothetical protein
VFRQVHRVLRREAPIIFSLPHPVFSLVEPGGADPKALSGSYFDREPRPWATDDAAGNTYRRNVGDLLTSLLRANFRIDTVLEPPPVADAVRSRYWTPAMDVMPSTLIIRARKEGL